MLLALTLAALIIACDGAVMVCGLSLSVCLCVCHCAVLALLTRGDCSHTVRMRAHTQREGQRRDSRGRLEGSTAR